MYGFNSRVRYSEVDERQRLTMEAMVNYFQDCTTFQSEDNGRGVEYMRSRRKAWMLSSWQIVIDRLPKLGEHIRISTWPYDFKAMYGYRNFMMQDADGAVLIKANSIWFLYDTEAHRPLKVQDEDLKGYGIGADKPLSMPLAPRKIPVPAACTEGEPIMVTAHHIDTNHHVNNAKYVEIAMEMLPEPIELKELRVEYRKAAVMGDVMIPHITKEDNIYTVVLSSSEGQPYAVVWMRS